MEREGARVEVILEETRHVDAPVVVPSDLGYGRLADERDDPTYRSGRVELGHERLSEPVEHGGSELEPTIDLTPHGNGAILVAFDGRECVVARPYELPHGPELTSCAQ